MRAIRFKFHASARARWKQIRTLAADEVLQMSLFDKRDLAEVSHPDFPGERLVVCRNPLLAEERERKREELIAAAEQKFETVRAATRRQKRCWRDRDKINYRLGRVLASSKVAKYFRWDITAEGLEYERNQQAIERDEVLDGVYVIRTSLSQEKLKATEAVRAYKRLAQVERAFRSLQSVDLHLRPIYHRLPDRVRSGLQVPRWLQLARKQGAVEIERMKSRPAQPKVAQRCCDNGQYQGGPGSAAARSDPRHSS